MATSITVAELVGTKTFGIDFAASISGVFNREDVALNQLSSSDWRVRCAAIEALVKLWKIPVSELAAHFDTLLADTSEEVRVFSILLLAGPSFDNEISDWPKRKLDAILAKPKLTDRERNAVKRGLELRSRREFAGVDDDLVRDTHSLLQRWETFQTPERDQTSGKSRGPANVSEGINSTRGTL